MNAPALALPTPTAQDATETQITTPMAVPAFGFALAAFTCVEQTAELLHLACRRGQLEDAGAAARIAMPLAEPFSPHEAMLQTLAKAQPVLMTPPEENRLYMLRGQDGVQLGLLRLRDNGLVGLNAPAGAARWTLHEGNLELQDATGKTTVRFGLCGERAEHRLYLGETLDDSSPRLLQEVRCTYSRLSMFDAELISAFCGLYNAEAMVPAELPARPIVMLGTPHSGNHRVAMAINESGGAFIDGALLHPEGIRLAEGAPQATQTTMLHAVRSKDPAWFACMMMNRSHDAQGRALSTLPARGFELAAGHSREALDWVMAESALRVVHVVRSHGLAEFADQLAEQAQAMGATGPLHFERERFERFIDMRQRYLDHTRARLMERSGETVEIDTSRMNTITLAELLSFMNDAPAITQSVPDMRITDTGRVIDRFDNPAEVLQCLTAMNKLEWMEAEGLPAA
jgi:hypothetical protein